MNGTLPAEATNMNHEGPRSSRTMQFGPFFFVSFVVHSSSRRRTCPHLMSTIRKSLIPAAGFGTRMLPAAKAVPKEMLPVLDRPAIQYVVEECAAAGADDVLLVTSRDKRALEDHFDRNPELEQRLAAGGKSALLASIEQLAARVKVHSVRQPSQRGLG